MHMNPSENEYVLTWIIIGALSAWGGVVRYLMDMQSAPGKWSWLSIISQIIISSFTGLMGGLLCFEAGSTGYMTFVTAGLAGSMGSSMLRYLWKRILNQQKES